MPNYERPSPQPYVETYDPTGGAPAEPASSAAPSVAVPANAAPGGGASTPVPEPSAPGAAPAWNPADPWGSMRSTAEGAMRRFQGLDPMTRMGLGAAALAALGGVAYAGSRAMGMGGVPARGPAVSPLASAMRGIFGGAPVGKPIQKPIAKKPMGSYYGWGKAPVKGKPWW